MKKYTINIAVKSSVIGLLALFLTSCEDFLDKNPTTSISAPTFWKTKLDADMALAPIDTALLNKNGLLRFNLKIGHKVIRLKIPERDFADF